MRRFVLAACAALGMLAEPAAAQRSVNARGERAGNVGGRAFSLPRASDLEDHSPVAIVLDRKKKLALTDSQVTALKAIAKALEEKNADWYRQWDSVRVTLRAASGGAFGAAGGGRGTEAITGASEVDREVMRTASMRLMGIRRASRINEAWARDETLKLLTPEQQKKADEYWTDDEDWAFEQQPALRMPLSGGKQPPGA